MDLLIIFILFISLTTSTSRAIIASFSNFLQIYFSIDFSGQLLKPAGFPVSPAAQLLSLVLGAAALIRSSLLVPCAGFVTILRESPSVMVRVSFDLLGLKLDQGWSGSNRVEN